MQENEDAQRVFIISIECLARKERAVFFSNERCYPMTEDPQPTTL